MIQANELRVGNYVQDSCGRYDKCNNIRYDWDSAFGVPLTPEILEKCGFKKRDEEFNSLFRLGKVQVYTQVYSENNNIFFAYSFGYDIEETEIKYLHQLQNLYFALTGEELNIQL